MPSAKEKSAAGLSIELASSPKYFTTGQTVSGDVTLEIPDYFAIGSVSIGFYGRVKVYYVQSHGQGESHWRGRVPLFSGSKLLYEGYHTHKPGSFRWPFEFDIPTTADVDLIKQSKHQWDAKEHFLSTSDYIPSHSLPASFDFWKRAFGFRWHIFVEYVLDVEVKQAEGSRVLLPPSSRKATLPILVKDVSLEDAQTFGLPLSAQFTLPDQLIETSKLTPQQSSKSALQCQVLRHTVRSSRLILAKSPESPQISSFSFREKTRQLFNSSALPRYTFELNVSTPETIRVLHGDEDPVPFIISAASVESSDHTTLQPHEYPTIRIDNISIYLTATTYLRCKGPFSTKPASFDIELLERHPIDITLPMNPMSTMTGASTDFGENVKTSSSTLPDSSRASVNLAQIPGAVLSVISAKLGRQTELPLSPTFKTYIIAREYSIKWKMELDIAGEKVKLQNKDEIPVKLLPPHAEALNAFLSSEGATTDANDESIDGAMDMAEDRDDLDSEEGPPDMNTRQLPRQLNRFQSRRKKKTKQEEANEERSRDTGEHATRSLEYRHDEILPRYETAPTDFGYQHEISSPHQTTEREQEQQERPPDYHQRN